MADYWKSIPKKYCEFCKCWITDNKASRDFHERGFRHQANVRRKVHDIQRNCTIEERERQQYQNEMLKIEAAALKSFKANDLARNPSLSMEMTTSKSIKSQIIRPSTQQASSKTTANRFGEDYDESESTKLLNGKQRALETIAKSFEKKSKWLEAVTSDGDTYYWNKETMETRKEAPKSGYLTISEQQQLKMTLLQSNTTSSSASQSTDTKIESYRIDPYGGWKTVEKYDTTKMIDLQLPGQQITELVANIEQIKQEENEANNRTDQIEFKEKTVDTLNTKSNQKDQIVGFKQRKSLIHKRNIRNRIDD